MEVSKLMQPTPQDILKRPYERVLIPEEDGRFSAFIPEFEGCFAQGKTVDEAFATLRETAISWIEAELEAGNEIPDPWSLQQLSGKLLLRLPKSLHRQVARFAQREQVSINQYVTQKLSASVREDQIMNKLTELLRNMRSVNIAAQVNFGKKLSMRSGAQVLNVKQVSYEKLTPMAVGE